MILQRKELFLRKALIAYLGAASEFTGAFVPCIHTFAPLTAGILEPEITIVLSPIITSPRHEDKTSRFIGQTHVDNYASWHISHVPLLSATVPTVGNAIEALTDLCDDIVETLKQMAAISAELDARDHVQVDNIRQVRANSFISVIILNIFILVPVTASSITRH